MKTLFTLLMLWVVLPFIILFGFLIVVVLDKALGNPVLSTGIVVAALIIIPIAILHMFERKSK